MDTNSNIPAEKKIARVEILHLGASGYGPHGQYTRRQWRRRCYFYLQRGKESFEAWQENCKKQINENLPKVSFAVIKHFGDETNENVLNNEWEKKVPFALDFAGREIEEILDISGYSFEFPVLFHAAVFKSNSFFSDATFIQVVSFEFSCFKDTPFFEGATFAKKVDFDESNFVKGASFVNTTFTGEASFPLTTFSDIASFEGATFAEYANFSKSKFLRQCGFNGGQNKKSKKTKFFGVVNFENAEIQNVGHFEKVEFNGEVPNFLGVDNSKTLLVFSGDEYFNKEDTTEDAVIRLGQLKRLADEQGQTDQALMFNAFELNAKRAQARIKIEPLTFLQKLGNSDFWFANATALYDIFSSYGRSFTKPLKYYLGLLLIVYILALGNAVVNSPKDCKAESLRMLSDLWRDDTPCDISKTNPDDKTRLNGYRAAAEYTVYRAAGILDFSDNGKGTDAVARRLFGQSYEPGWMRFIGLIKAIASTALLFLAALGLRNKYRIK